MLPMWVFTGFGAFLLAACAAFFSISGLAALYAAAFIPVVIMATTIEYGKISATFWIHRNYKSASKLWVALLVVAVIGSMAVTSGGVYGFLTKGHIEQESPITDINLQIERIDGKVNAQKNIIKRAQQRIDQLDGVIQTLINFEKISGSTGANAVRKQQTDERHDMQTAIDSAYDDIDILMEKRLPLRQKNAAVEAKLGPIKYLAALFGSDTDKSVQWFTLLIVLLLDPFAIMMVIATSHNYNEWLRLKEKKIGSLGEKIIEIEKIVEIEKEVLIQDDKRIRELESQIKTAKTEVPDAINLKMTSLLSENTDLKFEVNELRNREPEIKIVSEVVNEEIPLTIETLTDFLNNKEVQDELVKNPDLVKEVEKIMEDAKSKEESKASVGWVSSDGSPMEFTHGKD